MPAVGSDKQLGLGPCPVQSPRAGQRTDHVVATLDDDARDMPDLLYILQKLIIGLEESTVYEIVGFDSGEREGELILSKMSCEVFVGYEP